MRYDDPSYAHDRLCGTFVKVQGGKIAYINRIHSSGMVEGYFITKDSTKPMNYKNLGKLSDFDLEPFTFGYVNCPTGARYIQRFPYRQYKQGVRTSQFGRHFSGDSRRDWELALISSVRGRFPRFDFCVDSVMNEEVPALAFAHHFAVGKNKGPIVIYKNRVVGNVDENLDIHLKNKFSSLTESIEESLNVCKAA